MKFGVTPYDRPTSPCVGHRSGHDKILVEVVKGASCRPTGGSTQETQRIYRDPTKRVEMGVFVTGSNPRVVGTGLVTGTLVVTRETELMKVGEGVTGSYV